MDPNEVEGQHTSVIQIKQEIMEARNNEILDTHQVSANSFPLQVHAVSTVIKEERRSDMPSIESNIATTNTVNIGLLPNIKKEREPLISEELNIKEEIKLDDVDDVSQLITEPFQCSSCKLSGNSMILFCLCKRNEQHVGQDELEYPCPSSLDNDFQVSSTLETAEIEPLKIQNITALKFVNLKYNKVISDDGKPLQSEKRHPAFCSKTNLLNKHQNVHSGRRKLRYFSTNKYLFSRRSQKQSQEINKCTQCDYVTSNIRCFQRHLIVHTGKKPYACTVCSYATIDSYCLKRHMKVHASERLYNCDQCGYAAIDNYRLKRHMNIHITERLHKCDVCESTFRDNSSLLKHQKIHTEGKCHKCTICDFATARRASLTMHMRTHTGEKPYLCTFCGHRTAYQRHLKLHLMRLHFGMKPHKCDLCEYSATETSQLKKHMRIHTGEKPVEVHAVEKSHECSLCKFSTARQTSLKRHMRIHTGEKPYSCTDCGHETAYKSHLLLHQKRVHLGLKPYQCSLCSYSATAKSQLTRHMLTHNGGKRKNSSTKDVQIS